MMCATTPTVQFPLIRLRWCAFSSFLAVALGCGAVEKPPDEKPPPAAVKWEPPSATALEEWTELIGTTAPVPDRMARITAPVEGRVLCVFDIDGKPIAEGSRIEKGTPLVQLDSTVIQASLARTEALQEVLKEEEQQAKFAVDLAAAEVERLRLLKVEEDKTAGSRVLVSPVDRLKADFAWKDAQSKLKSATGRLAAGAKELDSLRAQLKLHTLASPIAGRVGRAMVVRGQTLSVGTLVAEVIDLDEAIEVICYVPPGLTGKLKVGLAALAGGFDQDSTAAKVEAEGQIVFIADQAEAETGNFVVKIRFENAGVHLRANQVQRVRVKTKPDKTCLSIRESAIQEDEEIPTVVIVTDLKTVMKDGKEETTGVARRLQVVPGMRDRRLHQIEIASLDDPEKDPAKKWKGEFKDALFVVEGGQGLQTGDAVKLELEAD